MTIMRAYKLLMLLAACLLASGCMKVSLVSEESGSGGTAATGSDAERTVLEFWHTYSEIETEVFLTRVLPLFEEQYPGIKIHAIRQDYTDQLKDTVLAAVADSKQPDVMRTDMIWVPELAKKGVLADLTDMPGFEEHAARFIGSLIQSNVYQGKFYGLPVNANTRAAIFNKKLLEQAGLAEPPATFRELAEATKRLKAEQPDVYGIGICCSNGWGSLPYFWTFGGQLMDDAYTRASGYLNGEASLAALRRMKDWLTEGVISPSILGGVPGTWDGILKGQLLMIDDAHWFYTVNAAGPNKELLENIVIGLLPSDANPGTSVIGGEDLVLFDKSEHKWEAWQFIRWVTTEEPQRIMAETGLIPTIKDLQDATPDPLLSPYLEQLGRANPRPPVPAWTEIEEIYARMIERILAGEQDIAEAANEAAAKIDSLLENP